MIHQVLDEMAVQAMQWSGLAQSLTRIERMLEKVGLIMDTPLEQDQTWFNMCVTDFKGIVPLNLLPGCWHLIRRAETAFEKNDKEATYAHVRQLRAELREVAKHCESKAGQLASFYKQ